MKRVFKIVLIITLVVLGLIAISAVINQILLKIEKSKYSIYGQYVEVDGKEMYLSVLGEGENTIVILPGSGCVGSTVLYRPLAKRLAENNKVIIVEYFGYGFSDDISKERSIENIVNELRTALNIVCPNEQFIFMPHSISGIYSLYYATQYPNEVKAIIGLDMTVAQLEDEKNIDWDLFKEKTGLTKEDYDREGAYPLILNSLIEKTGIMRWVNSIYNKEQYDMLESYNLYSEEELKVLKKEFNRYPSMALLKEYHNNMVQENISKLNDSGFPENLPILDFRATRPIEIAKEYMGKDTLSILNDTITNTEIQKIIVVEAKHETVFLDAIDKIVEETNEFINNIK